MARFTLPRDLYHGKGSLEALKSLRPFSEVAKKRGLTMAELLN